MSVVIIALVYILYQIRKASWEDSDARVEERNKGHKVYMDSNGKFRRVSDNGLAIRNDLFRKNVSVWGK